MAVYGPLAPSRLQRALANALAEVQHIQAILSRERPSPQVAPGDDAYVARLDSVADGTASAGNQLLSHTPAGQSQPALDLGGPTACAAESPGPSPQRAPDAPKTSRLSMFSNDLYLQDDDEQDQRDQDQAVQPCSASSSRSDATAASGPSVTPPIAAAGMLLPASSGCTMPFLGLDLFGGHATNNSYKLEDGGDDASSSDDGAEPLRMPLRSFQDALASCVSPLPHTLAGCGSLLRSASVPQGSAYLPASQAAAPATAANVPAVQPAAVPEAAPTLAVLAPSPVPLPVVPAAAAAETTTLTASALKRAFSAAAPALAPLSMPQPLQLCTSVPLSHQEGALSTPTATPTSTKRAGIGSAGNSWHKENAGVGWGPVGSAQGRKSGGKKSTPFGGAISSSPLGASTHGNSNNVQGSGGKPGVGSWAEKLEKGTGGKATWAERAANASALRSAQPGTKAAGGKGDKAATAPAQQVPRRQQMCGWAAP